MGGDSTWLTLDYADLDGDGYWDYDGTDATVVFAYQAFAGLRYNFNANASLGLSYRFYATGGPEFDVDNRYYDIKLDDIHTHSFNVVFTLRF